MSEEEKKAIEEIENYLDYEGSIGIKSIAILYTLFLKQQKEIEDWKFTSKYVEDNYISKDKIRKLLEEYKSTGYYEVERVLEELLEE